MSAEPNRTHPSQESRRQALVTGASAGIGKVFAEQLADRGYDLIVVARRVERLESLRDELAQRSGVQVEVLSADLADDAEVARVVEHIEQQSNIEVLVNNAGFGVSGAYHEAEAAKNLAMIRVHVEATARLTRAALPQMVANAKGYVINVSSMAGFFSAPGSVSYCATKAFLNSFSESLQCELRRTGVSVQALCPGFTYSDFHDQPDAKMDRGKVPKWMWMSAEQVVKISLDSMGSRQSIRVPGMVNRLLSVVLRSGVLKPLFYRGYGAGLKDDGPSV